MITPNVDCIAVCLYSWFSTTRGIASRLSSMTTRMPSLSDSSRRSLMPSSFLSLHELGDVADRASPC